MRGENQRAQMSVPTIIDSAIKPKIGSSANKKTMPVTYVISTCSACVSSPMTAVTWELS